jgi:hypothetical protein
VNAAGHHGSRFAVTSLRQLPGLGRRSPAGFCLVSVDKPHEDLKSPVCASSPHRWEGRVRPCYKGEFVLELILSFFIAIRVLFRSRCDTALEVLALR